MADKNLRIKIDFIVGQISQQLGVITKGLNLLQSSLRAVFRTGIVAGFFAALRVGINIVNNVKSAIMNLGSEFLQLRLKATETAAILSRGGDSFGDSFKSALSLSRDLSTQIGFSAQQIQEGLITAARSGLQLKDSLTLTSSAMQLATANGADFQETINSLIGVTRAFGVEVKDASVFADALSQAVVSSNVSLEALFEGLKNVSSIASTAFGESRDTIVQTTAALMTLNDAGIQGAKAGTKLRAAYQKFMGGTAQTTAVFTKYGVNLFQANAASQRFLGTLMSGQRATAGLEEKLNSLKNRQFELVLANKEGTEEFQKVQDELDSTESKLSNLEKGLDNVYTQFTLAGGKLKPFLSIMAELKQKVPSEVVGAAFGIRGGEAVMRIMKDLEKTQKYERNLKAVMEESEKGTSITRNMYEKFLDTVLVSWARIKNTAMAILGDISDGFFEALKPALSTVQEILGTLYRGVSENKGAFAAIFDGIFAKIRPILNVLHEWAARFEQTLTDVFTPGKTANISTLQFNKAKGLTTETKEVGGDISEKLLEALKSFGNSIVAILKAGLSALEPEIKWLAQVWAESLTSYLQAQGAIFQTLGVQIGAGFLRALANIPGNLLQGLGKNTTLAAAQATERMNRTVNPIRGFFGMEPLTNKYQGVLDEATGKTTNQTPNLNMDESVARGKKAAEVSTEKAAQLNSSLQQINGVWTNVDISKLDTTATNMGKTLTDLNQGVGTMTQVVEGVITEVSINQGKIARLERRMAQLR